MSKMHSLENNNLQAYSFLDNKDFISLLEKQGSSLMTFTDGLPKGFRSSGSS